MHTLDYIPLVCVNLLGLQLQESLETATDPTPTPVPEALEYLDMISMVLVLVSLAFLLVLFITHIAPR